jgi:hypothetical protein
MFRLRINNNAKAVWNSEPRQTKSATVSPLLLLKKRQGYCHLMKEQPEIPGNHPGTAQCHCKAPHNLQQTPRKSNTNDIGTKSDRFMGSPHVISITSIRTKARDSCKCREENNRGFMPHLVDIDAGSVVNLSRRQKIPKKAQQESTAESFDKTSSSPRGKRIALQALPKDCLLRWSTPIMYGAKVLISAAFFYHTRIAMSISMVVIVGLLYRNYLGGDTVYDSCSSQIPNVIYVSKRQNSCTILSTATLVSDDISLISETTADM